MEAEQVMERPEADQGQGAAEVPGFKWGAGIWRAVAVMMIEPINPRAVLLLKLAEMAPRSMHETAKLTRCSVSSITQIVDGLEAQGWVMRYQSREDRRVWFFEATPKGRELVGRIERAMRW